MSQFAVLNNHMVEKLAVPRELNEQMVENWVNSIFKPRNRSPTSGTQSAIRSNATRDATTPISRIALDDDDDDMDDDNDDPPIDVQPGILDGPMGSRIPVSNDKGCAIRRNLVRVFDNAGNNNNNNNNDQMELQPGHKYRARAGTQTWIPPPKV